jgi:DNA replication protein DnaC
MAGEAVCPKCGGAGWIVTERGGVSGAERCACWSQDRAGKLEDRAQIPPLYRSVSFDTFVLPGPDNPIARRELQTSLLAASNFVREFPNESRPGLLFIGEPGIGKTHLAVAVLRKILEKGHEGLFCDYQGLLDKIRSGYDPGSNSADKEAYRVALDAEVLLLDDLGAHRVTDWVEDTITAIITHRCNHRKPLIATTNLPDPQAGAGAMQKTALGTEYRTTWATALARARAPACLKCARRSGCRWWKITGCERRGRSDAPAGVDVALAALVAPVVTPARNPPAPQCALAVEFLITCVRGRTGSASWCG